MQTVGPRGPGRARGRQQQQLGLGSGRGAAAAPVMLQSQMGEPVRSKLMCAEGGRLGRAARRRSSSPRTLSAAEVCGWIQSGA